MKTATLMYDKNDKYGTELMIQFHDGTARVHFIVGRKWDNYGRYKSFLCNLVYPGWVRL